MLSLSFQDDRYLQISAAPLLCLFLIYWERTAIFSQARFSPRAGVPLLSVAMLLGLALIHGSRPLMKAPACLSVVFAVVLVWMAAFILSYGPRSFKNALFPLCCLFLMIPAPPALMDRITDWF